MMEVIPPRTAASTTVEQLSASSGRDRLASNLYCDTEEEDNDSELDSKNGNGKDDDTSREYAILMVEKFIADVEDDFERLRDFLDNKSEAIKSAGKKALTQYTYMTAI